MVIEFIKRFLLNENIKNEKYFLKVSSYIYKVNKINNF